MKKVISVSLFALALVGSYSHASPPEGMNGLKVFECALTVSAYDSVTKASEGSPITYKHHLFTSSENSAKSLAIAVRNGYYNANSNSILFPVKSIATDTPTKLIAIDCKQVGSL